MCSHAQPLCCLLHHILSHIIQFSRCDPLVSDSPSRTRVSLREICASFCHASTRARPVILLTLRLYEQNTSCSCFRSRSVHCIPSARDTRFFFETKYENPSLWIFIFAFDTGQYPIPNLVGPSGLEPPTSRLSVVRSSQLSYGPAPVSFLCRGINCQGQSGPPQSKIGSCSPATSVASIAKQLGLAEFTSDKSSAIGVPRTIENWVGWWR